MKTYLIAFTLGTCVASFLHVVALSVSENKNWHTRRSRCPQCHTTLTSAQLIPLFSYIWQRGRCAFCFKKIPWSYFGVECIGGLLFTLPLFFATSQSVPDLIQSWLLLSLLLTATLTDLYYGLIPNKILLAFAILFLPFRPNIHSAFIGFLLLWLTDFLSSQLFRKETLGGGDIKMIFVIGLVRPLRALLFSLLFSSLMALLYVLLFVTDKKKAIKFAPFISLGVLLHLVFFS